MNLYNRTGYAPTFEGHMVFIDGKIQIENFTDINNWIAVDNVVVGSLLIYWFASGKASTIDGKGLTPIYTDGTNLFVYEVPSGGGDIYIFLD